MARAARRRRDGAVLAAPAGWIGARAGAGKFKMNLHDGMHFVNTKNFNPPRAGRSGKKLPSLP